mgnify:FL=1|tara:strand:- start:758 stop:1042 length:285 start_codon:yes stop_codon:yes gene_type:complete
MVYSANGFSRNELKIIQNVPLKMTQKVRLDIVRSEYSEVNELLELFAKKECEDKVLKISVKKLHYDSIFLPIIKNLERILRNTEKRITYNISKC